VTDLIPFAGSLDNEADDSNFKDKFSSREKE